MQMPNPDEPIFHVDGNTVLPTKHGGGPWDPTALHGGAPAALLAWIAEETKTKAPMHLTRLSIDLMRPVPMRPLTIDKQVTREGRNIQTIEIVLRDEAKLVAKATALKIRQTTYELEQVAKLPTLKYKLPQEDQKEQNPRYTDGFGSAFDRYFVDGSFDAGNAVVWFEFNRTFIDGIANTPTMKAAATADFCNGVGSRLDFEKWLFINADLTIHFARPPVGDVFLLEADTMVGAQGAGLGYGLMWDEQGLFGRSTQSLVIAPR